MNSDLRLVVAYNFPPFSDASAVTLAKRIAAAGDVVDVVSQDLTGLRPLDDTLYSLVAPYVNNHHLVAGRPRFVDWASITEFATLGWRRLTVKLPLTRYGSVYSRSMWPHSHVLAGLIKIYHPRIRWVAEFSDPVLRTIDGSHRPSPALDLADPMVRRIMAALPSEAQTLVQHGSEVLHLIQALPCALADEVVFTNKQQRTVMLNDLGNDEFAASTESRSIISPHPTPPASWVKTGAKPDREQAEVCRIGYFGTLYANRGLGTIIEAVRLLTPAVRAQLQIDIHSSHLSQGRDLVARNGVSDVFHFERELPYTDFLSKASTYDHLLVTDTQTGGFSVANPFLPSKVSDYLATGVNIMALVAPGSELSKRGYQPSAAIHDVVGIRNALRAAVAGQVESRTR